MTLDTLPKSRGLNVREQLLQFHQQWYSSNVMAVVVLGRGELLACLDIPLLGLASDELLMQRPWTS